MIAGARDPLRDALVHLDLVMRYAREGDLSQQLVIDAVCMRLSAGIEALSAVGEDRLEELFESRWPLMWGMRNRIAHGYLLVNGDIVRRTVEVDVPPIIERIREVLR